MGRVVRLRLLHRLIVQMEWMIFINSHQALIASMSFLRKKLPLILKLTSRSKYKCALIFFKCLLRLTSEN